MSSVLPEGWGGATLGQCVDVLDSRRVPVNSEERAQRHGQIPYYGATGQVGWIDDYLFDEELVLLGEDGAPFFDKSKSIAYIVHGKSWVNNHAHVLRARASLTSNRFIKYSLDATRFDEVVNGTTRLKLTQGAMLGIPVHLPPVAEQHRIVEKVEALLEQVNRAKARLDRVPLILKRFRQALMLAACSGRLTADWREKHPSPPVGSVCDDIDKGGLPEIPDTWRWARLTDLGELARGKSRHRPRNDPKLFGGCYPFIQTGDVARSRGRITNHSQTYNEAGLAQSRLWPKDTVCITIAANIAESGLLDYPACFPDSVVGLITDRNVCLPEYAEFFIKTARSSLAQFAPATAQANINLEILSKEVSVPLPPTAEQLEIVRTGVSLLHLADSIESRVQAATARANKLPQAILSKAFAGELVPTEAELARLEGRTYETAEELLKRVTALGSDAPSARKGRGRRTG